MKSRDSRRPKVLVLTDNLKLGGVQRVAVHLAVALSARGYEVDFAAAPEGDLWRDLPPDIRRLTFPTSKGPFTRARQFMWLARTVRRGRYTVIHAHQRGVSLQARVARTLMDTRVVEHVHNTFTPGRLKLISFQGDQLIACSEAVGRMLESDFGKPAHKITVIPNSVADMGANQDLTLPIEKSGPTVRLLVIARVSPQKDPERLVRLIVALNNQGCAVEATWVGDGELLNRSKAVVDELQLSNVHFLGQDRDVRRHIESADLVLLTSRWEGLPLTLLEAASLGRPLAAPDVGGCREVVLNGQNGILFPGDATADTIADRLAPVLNASKLSEMGRASRNLYVQRFTPEALISQVEEVYAKARRE
jgi:glycosyltransferase involved in cell wall biosynthesis